MEKIPTFRELNQIPCDDNLEPLVKLEPKESLFINPIETQMFEFTGDDIYVRRALKGRLEKVSENLNKTTPELMIQVHYGYRHPSIQKDRYDKFLEKLESDDRISDKEQHAHTFIANPSVAGHPTGGAIDITLVERSTKSMLDMGTELRDFSPKTLTFHPEISKQAWRNRMLLRNLMVKSGFAPYDGEWWHFSYGDKEWAYTYQKEKAHYKETYFEANEKNE